MKNHLRLLLIIPCVLLGHSSFAWITYLNGRLDHVLYDEHDTRTVVHVLIEEKEIDEASNSENTSICYDYYKHIHAAFRVKNVILGDAGLKDILLSINTTSFAWPEDLVAYKKGVECILVLSVSYPEKTFYISAVTPVYSKTFSPVRTNRDAILLLENEILSVLQQEKDSVRQCEYIKQVAPVLQVKNTGVMRAFLLSENIWVKRAALAALVYASEKPGDIKQLAGDIESFFSVHSKSELIADIHGNKNHAPYPYYYQHVFFIEGRWIKEGSRWDEKEAGKNQRIFSQLIKTGVISKKVQEILAKQ